jgi:hypothetical protein
VLKIHSMLVFEPVTVNQRALVDKVKKQTSTAFLSIAIRVQEGRILRRSRAVHRPLTVEGVGHSGIMEFEGEEGRLSLASWRCPSSTNACASPQKAIPR